MIFSWFLSEEEKRKRTNEWCGWFAWYPVRIGVGRAVWLQYIQRRNRSIASCAIWEYRTGSGASAYNSVSTYKRRIDAEKKILRGHQHKTVRR